MIFFQTPTTEEVAPHSGDLFTFGEAKGATLEDSIDLIITDIQCGENLSADLTCVEYSPEIFGVDEDGFVLPDYESKISDVAGARDVIDMGMITPDWKTFFTYHDGEEAPEPASGDGTNAGWHYAKTTESLWVSTKTARNVYEGVWSAPTYTKGEKGAQGAKGDDGEDGVTIQILSSTGTVFKNGTGSTILTAHIYQGGIELDSEGTVFNYQWKKYDAAGNLVPSFTATTKSITVTANDVANKNDYEVEVTW